MSYEDERIVKMTFDSAAFQKNIQSTIRALERLDETMKLEDVSAPSSKAFDTFTEGVKETDQAMGQFDNTVNKVKASFTMLQIIGYTALSELTRFAINTGKKIYQSTLGQIKSGGATRALNIEAAKFQIEGLGHAWADVQEDIDYGVKDTAYGLDSAAKAASQLLASDVKVGDAMKVSLRGISGVAAMTNSTYDEIANIFTDVAGNGRLMGDQLTRIAARGLNAAQALKDYFNEVKGLSISTEQEVRDMVSKGKVSFQDFANAMDMAFGEHAKEANKTFTGAMSNMRAALSRVGEKFLTPWHEFERKLALSVIPVINKAKDSVAAMLPLINTILDRTASWVEKLMGSYDFQKSIVNVLIGIWGWIQNIIGALNEMGFHLPEVNSLAELLEKLTSKLLLNAEQGRKVREVVKTIVKALSILVNILNGILYILKPIFEPLLDWLTTVHTSTTGFVKTTGDIIDKINYVIKVVSILLHLGVEKSIKIIIATIGLLINAIKALIGLTKYIIYGVKLIIKALKTAADAARSYGERIFNVIKVIAEAFVKLYDTIREVIINASDGIDKFLEKSRKKTVELWDVINSLVGKKQLDIGVNIIPNISKPIDAKSMVSTAASSAKSKATTGLNSITSASNATTKSLNNAEDSLNSFGATAPGMGHIGQINSLNKELMQTLILTRNFRPGIRDTTSELVRGAEESSHAVEKMSDSINNSTSNIWLFGGQNSKSKDVEKKTGGVFDSILDKLEVAKTKLTIAGNRVAEHFSNFFNVLADVIIVSSAVLSIAITVAVFKIIGAIINLANMLPELIGALNAAAKGFKYLGMAEAFKGFAVAILALGGLFLTIALVSKFVDYEVFKKFIGLTALLILASSVLVVAIGRISFALGALTVIKKWSGIKPLAQQIVNFTNNLKELFLSLSILIATIVGSIVLINKLAQKEGGYDGLIKAAMFIATLIIGVTAFMIILTKVIAGSNGIVTTAEYSLFKYKRTTSNALGGAIGLLATLTPMIAIMVGSIALLAKYDVDMKKAAGWLGLIVGSMTLLISSVGAMTVWLAKILKTGELGNATVVQGLKIVLVNIKNILMAMTGFMLGFTASAYILSTIPYGKQDFAFQMMLSQMIFMGVVIAGICAAAIILQNSISKNAGIDGLTSISGKLSAIALIIQSIGSSMLAISLSIAASLAIISMIPASKLKASVAAFSITIAVVMSVIGILMFSLREFQGSFRAADELTNINVAQMKSLGTEMSLIIGAMTTMMLAISASLAIVSLIKPEKLWHSVGALTVVSGVMMVLVAVLMKVVQTSDVMTSTINSKVQKKGMKMINSADKSSRTLKGYFDGTGRMMLEIIGSMSVMMLAVSASLKIISTIDPDSLTSVVIHLEIVLNTVFGGIMALLALVAYMSNSFKGVNITQNRLAFMRQLGYQIALIMGSIVTLFGAIMSMVLIFDQSKASSIVFALGATALIFTEVMSALFVLLGVLSKMSIAKVTIKPKDMQAISMLIGELCLAMAGMMISFGILAKLLSMSPGGIAPAFGALISIFAILGIGLGIIVTFKDKITASIPVINAMVPLMAAFAGFLLVFGVVAMLLGKTDWSNISNNLAAFWNVILGITLIMVALGVMSVVCQNAIKPMIALALSVSVLVGIIGVVVKSITASMASLMHSFSMIENMNWSAISANSAILKIVMQNIADAISIGSKNIIGAAAVGLGLYLIMSGLKILETIDSEAMIAGANAIGEVAKVLQGSVALFGVIALALAFLGPMLAVGLVSMVLAVLVSIALIPALAEATDKAVNTIANLSDSIVKAFNKITTTFENLNYDGLINANKGVGLLILLGFQMFVAGVALAIGTGGLLLGAVLLIPALYMLKYSTELMNNMLSEGILMQWNDALWLLAGSGVVMIIASVALSIGVSMFLPTVALMLAAVAMVCLAMAQADFITSTAVTFIDALFLMFDVGVVLIAVGAVFAIAGIFLGLAVLPLFGAVMLLAATLGLIYLAYNTVDLEMILYGTGRLLAIIGALGVLATVMALVSVPLILATGGLMIAAVALSIAAGAILIGILSIGLALLAMYGLTFIIEDFTPIFDLLGNIALVMLGLIGVGLLMIIAGALFTIGSALLAVGAILFSVAIITFTISLALGSVLLLASATLLREAFYQFSLLWAEFDFKGMIGLAVSLLVFGALLTAAGLVMLIGSALMLPGAILLNLGASSLLVGSTMLDKTLKKFKMTEFVKWSALFLGAAAMLMIAGPMAIGAGTMILTFATTLSTAAVTVTTAVASIVEAGEKLGDVAGDFIDAGKNVVNGITEGIKDKASDAWESVKDVGSGMLDSFCDVLGINSPAREFIEKAAQCIAGIVGGLGGDEQAVYDKISSIGNGMLDKFEGFGDGFKSIGAELGDMFMGGMSGAINELMPELAGGVLGDFSKMLNMMGEEEIKKEMEMINLTRSQYQAMGMSVGLTEAQRKELDALDARYAELQKQKDSMNVTDWFSVAQDTMGNYNVGGSSAGDIDYSNLIDDNAAAALGGASGVDTSDLAKSVGGNVGTAITNNTYNFTQNNYSPEPIDRTELYTQTNNQLDTWYKWLRDNN